MTAGSERSGVCSGVAAASPATPTTLVTLATPVTPFTTVAKSTGGQFTDHWSAVHLQLSAGGDGESGPGLWRLPASQVPRPGVQRRVELIVRKNAARGGDLEALMVSLKVGLKAYTVEERKWVAATTTHLEREVGELRVKARKAKTRLADVLYQGSRYEGAKEALRAASDFYTKLFAAGADTQLDWSVDKCLSLEDVAALSAPWEEAEVKRALTEMALGKTPGRDGLPKELWESQWELLGKQMMLESVVSTGQFGFLPGRSIAGAVAVAADLIDVANAGQEDWLMLLIDFRKAFDSVARGYLFDVLRKMGFPETYVKWVEGLHQGAATRIWNDGWLGDEVPVLTGEARRRWLGINVKEAGKLTYLGYADDTTLLLGGRSQLGNAELQLKEFEQMSRLAVNWDKSVVLPLGRQRDIPPPADGAFKWASRDDPERLLGVWIKPGGDAQVYPPPDTIWEELRRLCHAFVSGGRASLEPCFILWNRDLMQLKREEGGLGVINLKDRLDAEALHSLAQLLTEEMPQQRLLAERAANFPLGYASLLAHEALLKEWGTGSERWKAIAVAAMK
ncbi:unnamed protein product [Closterium sp. Yama58-4]|nr:unnamed protein product [Closterium sp. Yama58-4]